MHGCMWQVLRAVQLRHPAAAAGADGSSFVPNDIILGGDTAAFMLLTGPNMGGKSTLLRQVLACKAGTHHLVLSKNLCGRGKNHIAHVCTGHDCAILSQPCKVHCLVHYCCLLLCDTSRYGVAVMHNCAAVAA